MIVMTKDRVTGAIGIAVGILFGLLSMSLPPSPVPDDPGPRVFPFLACIVMMVTGAALIVQKPDIAKQGEKKPYFTKTEWKRFFKILGVYLLYFLLLWLTGFIPASLISVFIVSTLFREGKKVVLWKQILISVAITFTIYLCFVKLLNMRLPLGTLIKVDL